VTVEVTAVADAPGLTVTPASGDEDTAIALDITSALTDVDGSESLDITISGVPTGATLSAGTDNGDGSWSLSQAQLTGLTITPPQDFSGSFDLTVTATATEGSNGDMAQTADTLTVTVDAVNDAPVVDQGISAQSTAEEALFSFIVPTDAFVDVDGDALNLSATLADGSALPAWLSFDGSTFSGTPDDPDLGTITVKVTASDPSADTVSTTFDLEVTAVNDAPVAVVDTASTNEDTGITILASSLLSNDTDVDGDVLRIDAVDNPVGGTVSLDVNGDVVFTPDGDFSGPATFDYTMTDDNGGFITSTVTVDVTAVADAPTLSITPASGDEDTAIALDITSALTDVDGSESLGITIAGVPAGATLSAGTDNGDGSWSLSAAQLTGLSVTPAPDYAGSFDLTVTATSTEGSNGDQASSAETLTVTVDVVSPPVATDSAAQVAVDGRVERGSGLERRDPDGDG